MNPIKNLDEKTQNWHADATLPPTLRARLSQAAPQKKRRRPTLALRYGLAACVGVSLGVGFVASKNRPRHTQIQTLAQDTKSDKAPSNQDFQKIGKLIRFWRGYDSRKYEAILFLDMECPSCKKAYVDLCSKTPWIRWGICHFPLKDLHPKALEEAEFAENCPNAEDFWWVIKLKFGEAVGKTSFNFPDGKGKRIVKQMSEAATAAGIAQVPTLWVRERASADGANPKGFWVAIGAEGIKTVLEKLR